MKKIAILAVGVLLIPLLVWGGDPSAALNFVVLKDYNGKPVRNASIVLHPVNDKGKQSRGGFELKTDDEGKTSFDGVPYGKLRVQVLASGFQTFGEDYDIQQPTLEITIKLKRPQSQYSIYEDSKNTPKTGEPSKKEDPNKKDDRSSGDQKPQ
jgi:Carboxypeptidase regulatory-like domain